MKSPTPKTKPPAVRRRITCKSCFGSGRIDDHESPVRRCDDCVGRGYYYAEKRLEPPAPRVPRARVLNADSYLPWPRNWPKHWRYTCIPCPTIRQAKAMAAWGNKTEEEQCEAIKKQLLIYVGPKPGSEAYIEECARRGARAIHKLLTGHLAK